MPKRPTHRKPFLRAGIFLTLLSLALVSITLYVVFHFHLNTQIQLCIASPDCKPYQQQTPWIMPALDRSYPVFNVGGQHESIFKY